MVLCQWSDEMKPLSKYRSPTCRCRTKIDTYRYRKDQGFTLLEILIALTLFGFLMIVIFGGVSIGSRIWESTETQLNDNARLNTVRQFMKRRLEGMMMPSISSENAGNQNIFEANEKRLSFITALSGQIGAGIYLMELRQEDVDYTTTMTLSWQEFRSKGYNDSEGQAGKRILIDGIVGLEISYFGRMSTDQPPAWYCCWPYQIGLPDLIRLTVHFPDGDTRTWPDLLVQPMVDAGPANIN